MKTPLAVFVSCLTVLWSGGTAFPAGPDCGCPDLVYSEAFQSKGLGYVSTPEYADAVRAVANGTSKYSPEEIPAAWRSIAAEWTAYLAMHPAGMSEPAESPVYSDAGEPYDAAAFLRKKEACGPALLYLASLEYRSRSGHEGVKPVLPLVVRAAAKDIEARVVAKQGMAASYAKRASAIGTRIAETERIGAEECSPGDLALAKSELELARREAGGVRTSLLETESLFRRAEQAADSILSIRRVASVKGTVCPSE